MMVVGLTGGIASGKSTVAELFARRGVPVIDADEAARTVVAPGHEGLRRIGAEFGAAVLTPDGELNRQALRQRVFSDPDQRRRLEALLHPLIRAELERQLRTLSTPYALLVVPLLLEAGFTDLVDRVLVVDVPEAVQIERVMSRDGGSRDAAKAVLAAQLSRSERRAAADELIDNTGSRTDLERRVDQLHQQYLRDAQSPPTRN